MVLQEGGPVLSSLFWGASMPHILLNGALAHVNAQLEEFAPDAFGYSELPTVDCSLPSAESRPRSPGISLVWEKLP